MGKHADRDRGVQPPGLLSSSQTLADTLICLFPAFQAKCLRSSVVTWVASADEPRSHRSGVLHSFSVCLSLFPAEMKRTALLLCGPKSKSYSPRLHRKGTEGRVQGTKLWGSKVVITTRSWPLSAPVETTVFDGLPVFSYLLGVIHLDLTRAKSC